MPILISKLPPTLAIVLLLGACGGHAPYTSTVCLDVAEDLLECPEPDDVSDDLLVRTRDGDCTINVQSVDDDGVRVGYDSGGGAIYRCCYPVSGTASEECSLDSAQ